jgi:uncharacterized membrane protein YadS
MPLAAIGAILALGAFSLFAFPAIGHALGMSDHAFGQWAGLAVDNTAEATAAGGLYSDAAAQFAVLAKTTRHATIGFVVLGYALYWPRSIKKRPATHCAEAWRSPVSVDQAPLGCQATKRDLVGNKAVFLWQKFPKFVLGFLLLSVIATVGLLSKPQIADIANLSRWAFLLTLSGVGLQTSVRDLRKQGLRPLAVGAIGEFAIAALTLVLIVGASRLHAF